MGQNSITMFTNDSGVAGGPIAYVQDAFPDVSDTPSNNTGLSSTVSSNPMNNLYANDDFPRFGPKTLWIKDLVLEPNRQLWVNGEPTYRIIWSEPFPSASGYVFGNVTLKRNQNQTFVQVRSVGDGLGVGGVFAKCMFIMIGNTASSASGTVAVDGVANTTVVDWSSIGPSNPSTDPQYAAYVAEASNEAYNIHDFRLTAVQAGAVMNIAGVVVYSENSSLSIDQFPGITYNNKTQSKTTVNTTLPLPSFAASLGGRSVIWKSTGGGYSLSAIGVSTISSISTGSSGTNILNVSAGNGSSFLSGYGVISSWGSSYYVGVIQSISTDALTVFPTLPFGISNSIYRYFQAGQSLSLNSSLNIFAFSLGSTEFTRSGGLIGFTTPFLDSLQRFCVWGSNYNATLMDGYNPALVFAGLSGVIGASGFVQVDGFFSAAEIEWFGQSFAVLSGTMCVNGLPVYSHANIGFTGVLKKSVFIEAGPGWNSFSFFPGSSQTNVGIQRINLYQRNKDISASYGVLAYFDTMQGLAPRAVNATYVAPGCYQRLFADQLLLKGQSLTRLVGATWPGGVAYACGLSAALSFQYYGTNFAILGGASLGWGASLNISVDAGANQGATAMNSIITASGGSMTFHSVSLSVLGGTLFISALDFFRTTGEMKSLQTFAQPTITNPNPVKVNRPPTKTLLTSGTGTYLTPYGVNWLRVRMVGGGGGGGQISGAGTGNAGTASTFGTSLLSAGGGSAGTSSVGGAGGTSSLGTGPIGIAVPGGIGSPTFALVSAGGGNGASSALGGSGGGAEASAASGSAGATNTGGGGGGGAGTAGVSSGGGGGGSGGWIDCIISNPLSSYSFTVGAGGALNNGGAAGGSGLIEVEENYG